MIQLLISSNSGLQIMQGSQTHRATIDGRKVGRFEISLKSERFGDSIFKTTAETTEFSLSGVVLDLEALEEVAILIQQGPLRDINRRFDFGTRSSTAGMSLEFREHALEASNPEKAHMELIIWDGWSLRLKTSFIVDPTCFAEFLQLPS